MRKGSLTLYIYVTWVRTNQYTLFGATRWVVALTNEGFISSIDCCASRSAIFVISVRKQSDCICILARNLIANQGRGLVYYYNYIENSMHAILVKTGIVVSDKP